MTDPRFYEWLWEMENEVRPHAPLVYYHVWDNYPAPEFNAKFYNSTDEVVCISKVTHEILKKVAPETSSRYLPHAVHQEHLKKYTDAESKPRIEALRKKLTS